MKRRDLLQAVGAATIVDVDALAGDDSTDRALTSESERRQLRRWLPPLSAVPDGRPYDVTVTRAADEEGLLDASLLGDADVHVGLVAPHATVSVGVGASATGDVEPLGDRGYEPVGTVGERSLYARRGRYGTTVALPGPDGVVVARGRDRRTAATFVRAVPGSEDSLPETEPAVAAALDLLGDGDVVSLRPTAALLDQSSADGPLVTGRRIATGASSDAVRDVAVYASAAESAAAAAAGSMPWSHLAVGPTTLSREGRALRRDRTRDETALGSEP